MEYLQTLKDIQLNRRQIGQNPHVEKNILTSIEKILTSECEADVRSQIMTVLSELIEKGNNISTRRALELFLEEGEKCSSQNVSSAQNDILISAFVSECIKNIEAKSPHPYYLNVLTQGALKGIKNIATHTTLESLFSVNNKALERRENLSISDPGTETLRQLRSMFKERQRQFDYSNIVGEKS